MATARRASATYGMPPARARLLLPFLLLAGVCASRAHPGEAAPGEAQRLVILQAAGKGPEVVVLGADGQAQRYRQDAERRWLGAGALIPAAPPLGALAAGESGEGPLIVLGRDDGRIRLVLRNEHGGWDAGPVLPDAPAHPFSAIATAMAADGFRQVIALGRDDGLPTLFMQHPSTSAWTRFDLAADANRTRFSVVALGAPQAGQLHALLLGRDDGQPYLLTQAKSGTWGRIEALPNGEQTPFSAVALANGSDGYPQALCLGRDDGQPYLLWKDVVTRRWHGYGALANPEHIRLSQVATGSGAGNLLQALCLGRDDGLIYQLVHSSNGKWSPLAALVPGDARRYAALAVGSAPAGALVAIGLGQADGAPYLFTQDRTTGAWTAAGLLTAAIPPAPSTLATLSAQAEQALMGLWSRPGGEVVLLAAGGMGRRGQVAAQWVSAPGAIIVSYAGHEEWRERITPGPAGTALCQPDAGGPPVTMARVAGGSSDDF